MKERIMKAAMQVAQEIPLWLITRKRIARAADCAPSLVSYYLGCQEEVITAIVKRAIEDKNDAIVKRAKAIEHPAVAGFAV